MDSPEDANLRALQGVNIPLGPFSSTFQKFPVFTKNKYIFKKEGTTIKFKWLVILY